MRVLVVEDEPMAQKALVRNIEKRYPQMQVVGCTGSVEETVRWIEEHSAANGAGMHGGWGGADNGADVIFMDVELADGNCFEIFRRVDINAKVIMTTAYDSYAIKAFEAGSLDYLLKPISPEDLDRAVGRVLQSTRPPQDIASTLRAADEDQKKCRERFIVRFNDRIVPVKVEDIAYFYSEEKCNFLCTLEGKKYIVDSSLDIIADELPQKDFFRISRGSIISVHAIQSIVKQPSGRLLIVSDPQADFEMTVSRSRVEDFLTWLRGS